MPSSPDPDTILANWHGMIDDDFRKTITTTFGLSENDEGYVYRSEGFEMTLGGIQRMIDSGNVKYHYWGEKEGERVRIEVPSSDIDAYISIFSSTTDTAKALKSFAANAKKNSPRAQVSSYLLSKRIFPDPSSSHDTSPTHTLKSPSKRKTPFPNPYHDIWTWSCHETGFVGPLPDAHYSHPSAARQTHPMLPVIYHHFGCACPSYEALSIISQLSATAPNNGVIDMACGSGYWTYLLRLPPFSLSVTAVDNASSTYRYTWTHDIIRTSGIDYLRAHAGAPDRLLLLVYPVTGAAGFTERVIRAYKGDTVVIVGTMNRNRFTGFETEMAEEWFERENGRDVGKGGKKQDWKWRLVYRVPTPSFAGKDEGLCVWRRVREGDM